MSNLRKGRKFSEDHRRKISESLKGRKQSDEFKQKVSATLANGIASGRITMKACSKHGSYTSTKTGITESYDSGWELTRMKFLDSHSNVLKWTKAHNLKIPYIGYKGKSRYYIPDFLITLTDNSIILDEVKGRIRCHETFEAKCKAAQNFCSNRNWRYQVTFGDGLSIL